jgi:phosphoenolpyruvate synthase/pyruvate phosphate dikinase
VLLRNSQKSVQRFSHELTALILNSVMPADIAAEIQEQHTMFDAALVAVRSSATAEDNAEHSWTGELESYLNVPLLTVEPFLNRHRGFC